MTKINFPLDAKSITLGQAVRIFKVIADENIKDFEKELRSLAIYTTTPLNKLMDVEVAQVDELFVKMLEVLSKEDYPDFKRIITVNGEEYGFIPDIEAMGGHEFMDIDNIADDPEKGGFAGFAEMLAILYRPIVARANGRYQITDYGKEPHQDKVKRAALFSTYMTYYDARGAIFFFRRFSLELASYLKAFQE